MPLEAYQAPSIFSRWTSRIAVFSLLLVISAGVLHRVLGMTTPVAFNLVLVALAGALLALVMGLAGAFGIWRTGRAGASRIVLGVTISLALLALPLAVAATARDFPPINDLTTDFTDVPRFEQIAKIRDPSANGTEYPGERFARKQQAAYPDLKPLRIDRSVKETYELVIDAAKRQKLSIVHERAPGDGGEGLIEAIDRTLILGLYDDVVIRVTGDAAGARVDLRSASRYGRNDLGQNAERMRSIMKEIVVRLEETVPTAESDKKADEKVKPGLKRAPGDGQRPVRRHRQRDPSLSDGQRAPGQKARQPARAYDQVPGIQPGRSFE